MDPAEFSTRMDLSQGYYSYGSSLYSEGEYEDALRQLHMSLYIKPFGSGEKEQLNDVIRRMDKDPADSKVRRQLADEAIKKGLFIDAVVENRCAMEILDDDATRTALNEAIKSRMKDPLYMKEFDMKAPLPLIDVDKALNISRELIDKSYFTLARSNLDLILQRDPNQVDAKFLLDYLSKREVLIDPAEPPDFKNENGIFSIGASRDIDQRFKRMQNYVNLVQRRIKKNWRAFPLESPAIKVVLKIDKEGKISDIVLSQPSKYKRLNQEVLDAINKAEVPPPPQDADFPVQIEMTFEKIVHRP